MKAVRATYRLQLHKGFTFRDAAAVVDYLRRLGISDLYSSPILQAREGSTHGYDIVDHGRLSDDLGGEQGLQDLDRRLKAAGLGYIVDIVPNHMGVGGADNAAWLNVLEWGPEASHAKWFDIDWTPGKLLVPILGEQFGEALEGGKLRLKFDAREGAFAVWAYDTHKLPICPRHYDRILTGELARSFAASSEKSAGSLKTKLANETSVHAAVARKVETLNASLHDLIQDQFWRAAHFKAAADDINYRRFFNVNELAGVRTECEDVFEDTHKVIFTLVDAKKISGLRVDHIDGLLDPKAYLARLRARLPEDGVLAVEKILASHESLREDWPIAGTTGYEFANLATGLLIDPAGEPTLRAFYKEFTGDRAPFSETARLSKHRIMEDELASELHMLSREIAAIAAQNPKTADFTRNLLYRAIKAILACFPVYRTYLDGEGVPTEADRRDIAWAVSVARKTETSLDPSVFGFLQRLLLCELEGVDRGAAIRCAMKVQQYSGPVMAKALEDTAFYRHTFFLALNEVGGNPETFATTPAAFHKANQQRAASWPRALLATSTHDTKRGEDARARLAVLSEIADEWTRQVTVWSRVLRARRGDIEGQGPPDRRDEYAFYQTLVATWPIELLDEWEPAALADYTERIIGATIKGVREAKVHSTWVQPNAEYEEAVAAFVRDALDPAQGAGFRDAFLPFVADVAMRGAHNTLVQTVIKLTVPGVPDIYQGCELWNLSMVDPDNRRPVDFAARERMLDDVAGRISMRGWRSGKFKLAATHRLLTYRGQNPDLFAHGRYEPVAVVGADADRVVAFARAHDGKVLLVIVARGNSTTLSFHLELPPALEGVSWRDLLSMEDVSLPTGLGELGVRVLERSP